MTTTAPAPAIGDRLDPLPITVIVPVRNAEEFLEGCLASVARQHPQEIIVVDGLSTDGTIDIARRYTDRIISDDGRGVAAARRIGVAAASSPWVALVDADVVIPDGALRSLFEEFQQGAFVGLQAGLESVSGPGYWGRALTEHHRTGRSKNWFGLSQHCSSERRSCGSGSTRRFCREKTSSSVCAWNVPARPRRCLAEPP